MSRSSDYAQPLSTRKLDMFAAIGCILVLGAGCRFTTRPGDAVVLEEDAGVSKDPVEPAPEEVDDEEQEDTKPIRASTGTSQVADAGVEPVDSGAERDAGAPAVVAIPAAPAAAGAAAPSMSPPTAAAGSAAAAPAVADAGFVDASVGQTPAAAAGAQATRVPNDTQCSADLASCLLRDPLGYAECLRENQDNGCPEPDAGVPVTTSPVTTEDGKPLTQACQAELANCIARLPTPENADACTEKARKCK